MGVKWGLYEHLRDTADAMRPFLSRITPSRVVFRAILVPRDPWDNSEIIVRARSLVTRLLTQTYFLTPDATCDPWKWSNTLSGAEIEPSCVGIGQKLISVDRKVYTTMVMAFPTSWLRIFEILIKPIHEYIGRIFAQTYLFRPSVGFSPKLIYFDRLFTHLDRL
jgi:hypothetical protein